MNSQFDAYVDNTNFFSTIGILAGSFKPAHLGHYMLAEQASKENDIVMVLISNQPRDMITPKMSKAIWELYAKSLPNLIVEITKVSPVQHTYDLIAEYNKNNPETKKVRLYCSEKDSERFNRIEKFSNKLAECKVILTPRFEDISATVIRESIGKQDFESLKDVFPKQININDIVKILKLDKY